MKGFKIKKGDLIVASVSNGIVTKTTAKYIYYVLNGHKAKMRKETFWYAHDTRPDVELHYGSTKYRRLQRKMRTLNLHGYKHNDVDDEVRKFLNFVELPCKIITGNSKTMKTFVENVVKEYEWDCFEESATNPGTLVVVEK